MSTTALTVTLALTELADKHSGDRLHRGLARHVSDTGRQSEADGGTEDVDDHTPVTKLTRRLPVDDDGAANVCRQQRIEDVEVTIGIRAEDELSDCVDDDVNLPERRDRLSEQPLDIEFVRDVAANCRTRLPLAVSTWSTAASAARWFRA